MYCSFKRGPDPKAWLVVTSNVGVWASVSHRCFTQGLKRIEKGLTIMTIRKKKS